MISNIHKSVVLHFDVIVWFLAEIYTVYQLPDMQHNHNNYINNKKKNMMKKKDGKMNLKKRTKKSS